MFYGDLNRIISNRKFLGFKLFWSSSLSLFEIELCLLVWVTGNEGEISELESECMFVAVLLEFYRKKAYTILWRIQNEKRNICVSSYHVNKLICRRSTDEHDINLGEYQRQTRFSRFSRLTSTQQPNVRTKLLAFAIYWKKSLTCVQICEICLPSPIHIGSQDV